MSLSNTAKSFLTVLLLFLVVGVTIGYRILADDDSAGPERAELPDTTGVVVESVLEFSPTEAQPVTGAKVVQDTLWRTVMATGQAEANRRERVSTRRAGVVLAVEVREGQLVQEGDLLVQLDTVEAAMRLEEARAALATARNDFRLGMQAGDMTDPELLAERESNLRFTTGLHSAEVGLRRAEMEYEQTQVRARFAGRVADIKVVEGQFAGAGTEVLTLLQLDPLKVEVHVPESEVIHIVPGRRADVRFTAMEDRTFQAVVETVNPRVEEDRSARVTLALSNPEELIKPGMYATARVEGQFFPDRILVPREAVGERDRRTMLFVLNDPDEEGEGLAEWRYVTTGMRNDRYYEIVSHEETDMVYPGEIVLTDGHHYLAHDWSVRLVEDVARAGGRPGR